MPLKLFLRGEVWHYRGTAAGRRLRGSTGVSRGNKEIAEQVLVQIEERVWRGRLYGPGSILTFAQAAILYRAAQKPLRYLALVEDHWRDTPVKDITPGRIRGSCRALYPSAKPATWNRQVIVPTQAIINFAAEQELCPRITVKRWPVSTTKRKPISLPWLEAFASASSSRLAAIAWFMLLTGARPGEAISLQWRNVDFSRRLISIQQTKTNSERLAHMPHDLIVALANIEGDRRPDARVFGFLNRNTIKNHWDAAIARAGIERLTPHSCRHGFATGLLQAGVDVVTVAKLGGWRSPAHVFATYGHASEDLTLTDRLTQPGHNGNLAGRKSLRKKRVSGEVTPSGGA